MRLRLCSGLSAATAVASVQALTQFSEFLAAAAPAVSSLAGVDRALLERYLGWLAARPGGPATRGRWISALQCFFLAIRQYGWDDTLPATAAFFAGDCPPRPPRLTRHLAEYVMAQVESPASLGRWPDPATRLVTLILIRCGLRACDACTLKFNCLIHDGQGAPYLRYYNTKMRREAAVPIDEELEADIRAQQRRVASRWPGGNPNLFPRAKANASGTWPLSADSYRSMLGRWLASCDIRNEHGQPVHLTAHQWRHTFACRLINRDVPQEVIRVLLDHESTQMTAHYARITDQTVRRHWEQATKVNINGERVTLDPAALSVRPSGPRRARHGHADAAQRLLRAPHPEELSARQRMPDLPGLCHRARVPPRTAGTAPPHSHADRGRQRQRAGPRGGDEPAGPHQPEPHDYRDREKQPGTGAADAS